MIKRLIPLLLYAGIRLVSFRFVSYVRQIRVISETKNRVGAFAMILLVSECGSEKGVGGKGKKKGGMK